MSEIAEKTAEVVAENVEDAIDGVVEVVEVFRNSPVALATAGVVGLVVGAGGAWMLAKKLLNKHYQEISAQEIAEAKEFYAAFNKVDVDGAILTPQDVMIDRHGIDAAVNALRTYTGDTEEGLPPGEPYDDVVDEMQIRKIEEARLVSVSVDAEVGPGHGEIVSVEKTETRNVFTDPTFDLEEEIKFRTEDKPYIITHDEFYEGEKDYDTNSLTYYEVDDTLTDEHDKPIEDINGTIGDDHLARFGSGSKDKNVVYIRNEKLEIDYEVTKSTGSYLEEVLGLPNEEPNTLKHSDQRDRRRAFRRGDE